MTTFDELFGQLMTTRARLEAVRTAGGHFEERATLQTRLHALRADLANARHTLGT